MSDRARLGILISGRGSNMLALAGACRDGRLPADVALVLADRPDAAGLAAARRLGLATAVVDRRAHAERADFDAAIDAELIAADVDWVVLAGFMRVLGAALVERRRGRMLNIHPSLLPRHPGLDTHARALAAGDREHGASVHHVTAALDAGPVVARARLLVRADDDAASLAARVLELEHDLYIEALQHCLDPERAEISSGDPSRR